MSEKKERDPAALTERGLGLEDLENIPPRDCQGSRKRRSSYKNISPRSATATITTISKRLPSSDRACLPPDFIDAREGAPREIG
jgi:hypothetical protein